MILQCYMHIKINFEAYEKSMKKVLLTVLCGLLAANAFAQSSKGTGKISGVVIDSTSKQPIDFATIALMRISDAKSVNGGLSDDKGVFKLTGIPNGDYKLVVTFIGYKTTATKKISITDQDNDIKVGRILLQASGKQLNEVTVVGQKELVENKIDKMVYNAEKDVTSRGGDAGDILRKVPMVSVDMDGNIELRGSSNVRVLINGKPSTIVSNNVADAMKMIPADQIKNVEVITNPSAKYDAEGTAGIINIVTKKTEVAGVTGNISLNGGTRFNRGNGNINYRKGKLGLNAGASGMYFIPADGSTVFLRNSFIADTVRTNNQNGSNRSGRNGGNMNFGFDYDLTKTSTLSSSIKYSQWKNDNENAVLVSNSDNFEGLLKQYNRNSENNFKRSGLDWSTDYRKTFAKPQQELSLSFQMSNDDNNTNTNSLFDGIVAFPDSAERSFNKGANRELTFQADYAQPLSKKVLLEVGGKTILRDITSKYAYEVLSPEGNYEPVASRNNEFDYTQNVYAGYASFSVTFNKSYSLKAGGRLERTEISGDFMSTEGSKVNNSYNNFVPSITLQRSFKDMSSLKVSYSRRIQRPGLRTLNPFIDATDPQNISFGNPFLSPEKTNSFELGYSKFMGKSSVNASLYYKRTSDVIESVVFSADVINGVVRPVDTGRISATTYMNIASSSSVGLNLFGSLQIGQRLTLRGNANIYTYNVDDPNVKTSYSSSSLLYSVNANASWSLPKDFAIEAFGMFNSPRRTIQGQNPSFSMFNIGFKKDFLEKRASLGMNLSNPFNEYRDFTSKISGNGFDQSSQTSVPFRSIGISFSYRFGKMDFNAQQKKGKPGSNKKTGVNNDDIKQETDAQQGGM